MNRQALADRIISYSDTVVGRIAFGVRISLIWLFAGIVIVGIWGSTRDLRCLVVTG